MKFRKYNLLSICLRTREPSNIRKGFLLTTSRGFSSCKKTDTAQQKTQASSLLSQALDQRQSAAQDAQMDSAGPFMLGSIKRLGPTPKKWKELSTKGKVYRSTARTSNLLVIVAGAGLTGILAYTLLSDLFSPNSPTVKYGEACKLISQSRDVQESLPGSLVFHNNPSSSIRPRHRNRHVSSQLFVDSSGREHLILHFYARASPERPSWLSKDGYLGRPLEALRSLTEGQWGLSDLTDWVSESARAAKDKSRRLFLYLIGDSEPSPPPLFPYSGLESTSGRQTKIGNAGTNGGVWSSITGIFSGLGKTLSTGGGYNHEKDDHSVHYEEAEIHCDLVKDDNGKFQWRYIIADMPSSQANYPKRVFVYRAPGVRDLEPVMRWK